MGGERRVREVVVVVVVVVAWRGAIALEAKRCDNMLRWDCNIMIEIGCM